MRDGARKGGSNGKDQRRNKGGREGVREGGKLQGMYPEEGTGQYTVYSAQTTHNAALALETLVLQMQNSERVYKL